NSKNILEYIIGRYNSTYLKIRTCNNAKFREDFYDNFDITSNSIISGLTAADKTLCQPIIDTEDKQKYLASNLVLGKLRLHYESILAEGGVESLSHEVNKNINEIRLLASEF